MKLKFREWLLLSGVALLVLVGVGACAPSAPESSGEPQNATEVLEAIPLAAGEKLQVVATTSILGDIVHNVGGDRIELTTLMAIGEDPHSFVPTPADTAAVHDAHVVFANGLGLEASLEEMLESAGGEATRVYVSDGLEVLAMADGHEGEVDPHDHGEADPHVWFSVPNVIFWVEKIERTLGTLDPDGVGYYEKNAEAYIDELEELDTWVQAQVTQIPEANRKLVTNHPIFGYFAHRYGLEQLGAVFPLSPSSEPSAQDIAALEDTILEYGVPAVFSESTVNPKLVQQVAEDTAVELIPLYSGSLGKAGSGAETYVLLIQFDTEAIVDALK